MQLLAAAADVARERGYRDIRLDAYPDNAPAIALYEKCGYEDRGTCRLEYDSCGNELFVMMELML